MEIEILDYNHDRDFEAAKRIMYEVGWLADEKEAKAFEAEARASRGFILPIDGEAECVVLTVPGTLRHGDAALEMTAFTGVVTGRIARRLGAARRLTAHALSVGWGAGSEVAALNMFDQGYYDRLGFGTGAYEHRIRFDPATLRVDRPFRPPRRLTGRTGATSTRRCTRACAATAASSSTSRKWCSRNCRPTTRRIRRHIGRRLLGPAGPVDRASDARRLGRSLQPSLVGVRGASSLAVTDDLRGDGALLRQFDRALRLPQPHFGWPF